MLVWNITCICGHDVDYGTATEARKCAKNHITCNDDGVVYIDQVQTEPGDFEDYQTGRSIKIFA